MFNDYVPVLFYICVLTDYVDLTWAWFYMWREEFGSVAFLAGPEVGLCSEDWRLKSSDWLVVWGAPPRSCGVHHLGQ